MLLNKNTAIRQINIVITQLIINLPHPAAAPESIYNALATNVSGDEPTKIIKKIAMWILYAINAKCVAAMNG